eukprot:CAMPEP_0119020950 /NCGR_PEP_ID=MMETSP1176-20130426/25044_1 /TAXON_ID=265551 /ORGANISM="Synedropsis recta cf, Strain CCMP1620" /LENGTH=102 /DNA_ID=CAMNT_0006975461 /DNA_START=90 /DNA_END=395 /DNA_ORIENTATION=+
MVLQCMHQGRFGAHFWGLPIAARTRCRAFSSEIISKARTSDVPMSSQNQSIFSACSKANAALHRDSSPEQPNQCPDDTALDEVQYSQSATVYWGLPRDKAYR